MFPKWHLSSRQRTGLRTAVLIVWAGLGALLLWGPAHLLSMLGYLLATALLPLGWPAVFGQWRTLIALLAGITLPLALLSMPGLRVTQTWQNTALVLQFTVWLMLPATLTMLLWRRRAAAAVILLGMALLPVSTLLILQSGAYPTTFDAPVVLEPMTGMVLLLPMWLVLVSCSLGPLFFGATLVWLLAQEVKGVG